MTDRTRAAPPTPSRVRIVRPSFYRSEATGSLPPDVRDLMVGLSTLSDDEGWLLWRPAEIAAALYAYAPSNRRVRDLARRAEHLAAAGLLTINECGCAYLPTLTSDHGIKGGNRSSAVWGWHSSHPKSEPVQTGPRESVSYSVSDSASSSLSVSDSASGSASSRAGKPALPPRLIEALKKRTNGSYGELDDDLIERATTFLGGKVLNEDLLLSYLQGVNPNGIPANATFYLKTILDMAQRTTR